ncbi:MAG: hypothetical protein ABIW38_03810 [Ferruginibacter sp.]
MKKFYFLILIFIQANTFCQPLEEKMVEALDSFSLLRPQEKSYLQTDKSIYLSGETIWFKVYTLLDNKPSALSKITYVILADEAGKVLSKKMIPLQNGTGKGDIDLISDLGSGNYFLTSYSLWMLNFPAFICTKKIQVYNAIKPVPNIPANSSNSYALHFMPEGGNIIEGLDCKVAFKATTNNLIPTAVQGIIKDNSGNQIANFNSSFDGMGTFQFMPVDGKIYEAEIQWPDGKIEKKMLPGFLPEGININVDNSNAGKTFIKVSRSQHNAAAYNDLLLVAQQHYKVVYMARLNMDEGMDAVAINKKNLPPGIVQLTVLNGQGTALAERLFFVANHETTGYVSSNVNSSARAKNNISISLPGWKKINGAISVVNTLINNQPANDNIYSSLLLTSDLHGNIHAPYQYFLNKEDSTIAHLDLLMMTNGWRRFTWPEIIAYKYAPLKFAFETTLYAAGTVMQANGKTPLTSGKINLIIKGEDSTTIMSEANINSKSQFVVDNINFQKEATLFYQGTNLKKENGIVTINLFPAYIDTIKRVDYLLPDYKFVHGVVGKEIMKAWDMLPESGRAKTLDAVVVKTKKISVADSLNQLYATDIFQASDQTLVMDEGNYYDIWQYLQRMVPGIAINKTDTGTQVNFGRYAGLGVFSTDGSPSGVTFFLNEVPVSIDIVDFINPNDVALVKVFKGASGIAIGANRGAIALYTTKGKSTRDWRQRGFDFIKKTGFSVNREFYTMDYSKINPDSEFADIRNTLYWNTELLIKNEKLEFEFYNDDSSKHFKLTLEGVDENGKLLHVEKILN